MFLGMRSVAVDVFSVALAVVVAMSCKPAETAPPVAARPPLVAARPLDDRAQLVAGMHRYDELVQAMDSRALADMFTADGSIANAGEVIATGPAAIARFLASFEGKVRVEATGSTIEHVRIDGDRGFIDGHYAQDARLLADDKVVHVSGKLTGEWAREAGGAWRIRKLETTPDPPSAP